MLDVISFKIHNPVFNITRGNNKRTICTPRFWKDPEFTEKLDDLTERRKINGLLLRVEEINERAFETKIGGKQHFETAL